MRADFSAVSTWLQVLPKLRPGVAVLVQHVQGATFQDRIEMVSDDAHYLNLVGGTYSMRNGWHVLGERRIVGVVDEAPKPPHVPTPRENLIKELAKRKPKVAES